MFTPRGAFLHAKMKPPGCLRLATDTWRSQISPVMNRFVLSALFLATLAPLPANAGASAWFDTPGGRLRLVTAEQADSNGILRGALQIDLRPGWKTYWRDPGDAGVPPTIAVDGSDNISEVEAAFPVPERFHDGNTTWAGYEKPVTLALSFTVPQPKRAARVSADVFLGICQEICIPVQARLEADAAGGEGSSADDGIVASAFEALPAQPTDQFGATSVAGGPDEIRVEAHVPHGDQPTAFFLASSDGYYLAQPEKIEKDGRTYFSVRVLEHPDSRPEGDGLHYTLVAGDRAVSGVLPYPRS